MLYRDSTDHWYLLIIIFVLAQEFFYAVHYINMNKAKKPTLTYTLPFVDIQSIHFPTFTDFSKKKSS